MVRGAWVAWSRGLLLGGAIAGMAGVGVARAEDAFTPLVARVLSPPATPIPGTDGRVHLVYELELVNTTQVPANPTAVRLVDATLPERVLASFEGQALLERLHTTDSRPVDTPTIAPGEVRILLVDVALAAPVLPAGLLHRLEVEGASSPAASGPSPLAYLAAPLELAPMFRFLGPPLRGGGWVAVNGCCGPTGVHRSTGLPVDGELHFAQRFAIDWMRLDGEGRLVTGDPAVVESYPGYGSEVIAVADGVVVSTLDTLPNQTPGQLPDPTTITLENVDGNHVILDLGDGHYTLYAHLAPGSVLVRPGDRVTRGQPLARLGNSGNTSGPHLHFHLMDGPSALGSSGLPYVLDSFALAGQISPERWAASPTLEGSWVDGLLPAPQPRSQQFPLDRNVIDFPE
jgi:hypothetical protein